MKKLIVLSVIFALLATAVFAEGSIGGEVFGLITPIAGDNGDDSDVTGSGGFSRIRMGGSGQNDDGTFGGWIRLDTAGIDKAKTAKAFEDAEKAYTEAMAKWVADGSDPDKEPKEPDMTDLVALKQFSGHAWWKPMDQFKLIIGNNPDGFWGKDNYAWGFIGVPGDAGVAINGHAWGPVRAAFFGGYEGNGALLEIKPLDMLGINIGIPFLEYPFGDTKTGDIFQGTVAQIDLNLDFGNIAFTYWGQGKDNGGKIFLSFSGNFDALGLDVGFGTRMKNKDEDTKVPFHIGAGLTYSADPFGVKFRAVVSTGYEDKHTEIIADVKPYYAFSESVVAYVALGITTNLPDEGDSTTDFYFNPYVRVGGEYGPAFIAGLQVNSKAKGKGDDALISWSVPIAIVVGF